MYVQLEIARHTKGVNTQLNCGPRLVTVDSTSMHRRPAPCPLHRTNPTALVQRCRGRTDTMTRDGESLTHAPPSLISHQCGHHSQCQEPVQAGQQQNASQQSVFDVARFRWPQQLGGASLLVPCPPRFVTRTRCRCRHRRNRLQPGLPPVLVDATRPALALAERPLHASPRAPPARGTARAHARSTAAHESRVLPPMRRSVTRVLRAAC